jgi:dUTP pyrophosphatase
MKISLRVKKLDERATIPTKGYFTDLGYDLYAIENTEIPAGVVTKVRTGIAIGFPMEYGAIIKDRSSMATKAQIQVVGGVIDQGYTGEIIVAFYNGAPFEYVIEYDSYDAYPKVVRDIHLNNGPSYLIKAGDKIAQLVLQKLESFPIIEVNELGTTYRGENGFGSTGI